MHLPPLKAMRAFEVAARHENFSLAAIELNVSQGAVSRQIKILEDFLKVKLFHRYPQGVKLTETGQQYLPELSAAFGLMTRASQKACINGSEIRIISMPTFTARWLIPKLLKFREANPDVRVKVSLYLSEKDDLIEGNFDLGIWHINLFRSHREDIDARLLRREALTPVCSPSFLERNQSLTIPKELSNQTLLHPTRDGWEWKMWFKAAGISHINPSHEEFYDTSEIAIRAAVAGLGVTVCDMYVIQDELNSNQLVKLFNPVVIDGTGYHLIAEKGRFEEPGIKVFVDWILKEISADCLDSIF